MVKKSWKTPEIIAIFVENPSPWRSLRGVGEDPQPHHMMSPYYVIEVFQYGQIILKDYRDIAIFSRAAPEAAPAAASINVLMTSPIVEE